MLDAFKKLVRGIPAHYESKIMEEHVSAQQMNHVGMLSTPSAVAYDNVKKILAVGDHKGTAKIYGFPSMEILIPTKSLSRVLYLDFLSDFLLISYYYSIELYSITKQSTLHIFQFPEGISVVHHRTRTEFLFVGLNSGEIQVLNITKQLISPYKILPQDILGNSSPSGNTSAPGILCLQGNPVDENSLLIGNSEGNVIEWDLKSRKIKCNYGPGTSPAFSLAWNSDGSKFASGHENGQICIWKQGKSNFISRFYCGENCTVETSTVQRRSIPKIAFLKLAEKNDCIIALGGGEATKPNVIHIIPYSSHHQHNNNNNNNNNGTVTTLENDFDFCFFEVVRETPEEGSKPNFLLHMTVNGRIGAMKYNKSSTFTPIPSPQHFLTHSRVILSQIVICRAGLIEDIRKVSNISRVAKASSSPNNSDNQNKEIEWPVIGGIWEKIPPNQIPKLLITAHEDGKICFWDVTLLALDLIYTISIRSSSNTSTSENFGTISGFKFCRISRILAVGTNSGYILLYTFSSKNEPPKFLWEHSYVQPDPITTATSQTPSTTETIENTTNIDTPNEEKSNAENTITTQDTSDAPNSDSADTSDDNSITDDSEANLKAKENEISEMLNVKVPNLETPKKSRNKARAARRSNRDKKSDDVKSPRGTSPLEKISKVLKRDLTKNKREETPSKLSFPNSPNVSTTTNTETTTTTITNTETTTTGQTSTIDSTISATPTTHVLISGFQLVMKVRWTNPITSISLESGLNRVAVGDNLGTITMFDISPNERASLTFSKTIVKNNNNNNNNNTDDNNSSADSYVDVTHILFHKQIVQQQQLTSQHEMMFIGLSDGRIQVLDLTRGTVTNPIKDLKKMRIIFCAIITERGRPILLHARQWRENTEGIQEEEKSQPQPQQQPQQQLQPQLRFLLIVSETFISIYSIPNWEKVAEIQVPIPLVWANVFVLIGAEKEDDCCVITLDKKSNVNLYSLMNLRQILTHKKISLQDIVAPSIILNEDLLSATSATLDGSLFLFSKSGNEISRISLFPKITDCVPSPVLDFPSIEFPCISPSKESTSTSSTNKGGGIFRSIFGTSKVNLVAIFDPPIQSSPREQLPTESQQQQQKPHNQTKPRSTSKNEDQGGKKSRATQVQAEVSDVRDVMNMNIQRLNERGEKLSSLENATEEMANEAASFRDAAKRLRQRQQESWF